MTMDNASAYRHVLEESVKRIRNSFLSDGPAGKTCEPLNEEFEPYLQMS